MDGEILVTAKAGEENGLAVEQDVIAFDNDRADTHIECVAVERLRPIEQRDGELVEEGIVG